MSGTIRKISFAQLRQLIRRRWPQALYSPVDLPDQLFFTRIAGLDALFPGGGIPYGQLIEITGGVSSGKTSLLFRMLAGVAATGIVGYVDFGDSFFPSAVIAGGVEAEKLLVVKPDCIATGIRTAELLFKQKVARCVVLDLVGVVGKVATSMTLLHRLRQHTVRAGGLGIFLTEGNSQLIPASMVSLRLEVRRRELSLLEIIVTKSRISKEGRRSEVRVDI